MSFDIAIVWRQNLISRFAPSPVINSHTFNGVCAAQIHLHIVPKGTPLRERLTKDSRILPPSQREPKIRRTCASMPGGWRKNVNFSERQFQTNGRYCCVASRLG